MDTGLFPAATEQAQHRPLLVLGLFLLLIGLERWRRPQAYDRYESLQTGFIAAGHLLLRPLSALLLAPLFVWVSEHRLLALRIDTWPALLALFLCTDLAYYIFHRASHRLRWLWATHAVHHSSTHFNLSAALRLGWTDLLSGAWIWPLSLAWIGFPLPSVLAAVTFNLLFQFFLHTETVGRLGPLEQVFNTPRHHRVHHACDAALIDRNFGGVLIVWDRCFGTYAEASHGGPLRFGLAAPPRDRDLIEILFGEWKRLLRGLIRRKSRGTAHPP